MSLDVPQEELAGGADRAGDHFCCSMTAVLLARVGEYGGEAAVSETLRRAGSTRTAAYLSDIGNWISYGEATALWHAGAQVTHHPAFARAVGEDAARRLNSSPVASLLRSLGAPENVYRQIAIVAAKFSTVVELEADACGAGHAELIARPVHGFSRAAAHCEWTAGLLSQPTLLFGLPPARVEHTSCAAYGAEACRYVITWPIPGEAEVGADSAAQTLLGQLDAMQERLHSMFQTAADLIGSSDVDDVLARIAERAAAEVRAPRHLLAVRMNPDAAIHCHHAGFADDEADAIAERLLSGAADELTASWLTVPIRSNRRDYGCLLAGYPVGGRFFPQERELLEVYARYAASALDNASALREAQSRYGQSSALLELARELAVAGTSDEIARRLADSVPVVVDCDQVAVYVWDEEAGQLTRQAVTEAPHLPPPPAELEVWQRRPGSTLERLLADPRPDPIFIDATTSQDAHALALRALGFVATIIVPLVTADRLLGMLTVAVRDDPARLRPAPDLLDRLSGVGAQASTALQNGRLVDLITHQAEHDQLTGLANRGRFTADLRDVIARASEHDEFACLFYLDLDRFKPVNDELGHEAGDELLVGVADRLRRLTRGSDVVARLGGDEFAVLVAAARVADIDTVGRRLVAGLAEPFMLAGREIRLEASIGRAVFPDDGDDPDCLLRRADQAMFVDKRLRQGARTGARLAA